ncbi:MAG: nicotinamidase [Chitinispirillaceae bacterium]
MNKILVITDMQNDFCPGGRLPTENGAGIIPNINALLNRGSFDRAIALQDWHPVGHISFASAHPGKKPLDIIEAPYGEQQLWPDHCVQATKGADFHPLLDTRNIHFVVRKGYHLSVDSYSGFYENDKKTATGMNGIIDQIAGGDPFLLVVCGIATDYCVINTAMDAREILGYRNVVVPVDACAGITPQSTERALEEMSKAGVELVGTDTFL